MRQKLIYMARWQASAAVMAPFMSFCITVAGMSAIAALFAVQAIGAVIFWNVDKWIFKDPAQPTRRNQTLPIARFAGRRQAKSSTS